MAKNSTRLELTWIGKDNRPKLEPRILIEDPEKSYHAAHRVSENDIFDNRLIFGDNLLALKALEQEFTGKIKCIFIDPPYNTGSAFEHYDDGIEHSLWLSLMRDRLEILCRLLSEDGSLWITIDDREAHYLKILCDEIFGRKNFIANVIWQKRTSRENRAAIGSSHDHVLVYAKMSPVEWKNFRNLLPANEEGFSNPDNDPKGPWRSIPFSAQGWRPNQMYQIETPTGLSLDPPQGRCWGATEEVYQRYKSEGRVYFPREGNGRPRIKSYMGEEKGLAPNSIFFAAEAGDNQSAKKEVLSLFPDMEPFATPKPEKLLKLILTIATKTGDLVLDSFAGSGTTGAVAHKMGRRWIMVELGEHCHTHIIPRIKKVINGDDQGGISTKRVLIWESKLSLTTLRRADELIKEMVEVESSESDQYVRFERKVEANHLRLYGIKDSGAKPLGGGYRYYCIGPTLIIKDEWDNPVINPKFNPTMLAKALCKLEGFTFDPDSEVYWQQGKSTETDFIYVTTQFMSKEMLTKLSEEVGPNRSLLICCSAFRCDTNQFENLTVKKIPKAVLSKCEWGHDDYSLEIKNLPAAPPDYLAAQEEKSDKKKPARKFGKGKSNAPTLFNMDPASEEGEE